ncbi:NAD-glutamate dehydrogenase [Vibrio chagasii]|nr:NAD-glutamate dehydrogenase [Vibrio chagasii]
MHIFIDESDSASSWVERDRLFNLPRSSWEDYNKRPDFSRWRHHSLIRAKLSL